MPRFEYSFVVDAPLGAVRKFHRDTSALRKLTPPPAIVQLHASEPVREGSVSEFTLWLGPVPVRWKAVHRDVSERGFTDVQAAGPAERWEHTHAFVPLPDGSTEIRERVDYDHKPGLKGLPTRVLFSWPSLWLLFGYRRWATQRALRHKP